MIRREDWKINHLLKEATMQAQPKESPEMEFMIKALTQLIARTEALANILEARGLIVSKEQIENDTQNIFQTILDVRRNAYISALNLERWG